MFLVVFLNLLLPLSFLTRSGFFNGMSEIFKPGALNHFILSRFILLILSVPRNPNLTHLPLSVSLNTLPCDLIALTGGLAFFLLMIRSLTAASSFWLGRAHSFLNFLKSFICLLDRNSDYAGVNISLNIFFSLFMPYSFFSTNNKTDSFSASNFSSSRNFCTLGDFNCHQPLWESKGTSDPHGKEVLDWIISSDLFPLNDPDTSTLLHCSSGSRCSSHISFASFSLAVCCSWEVLRNLSTNCTNCILFSGLSPQRTYSFLQFSESSLGSFCFSLRLSLSFCKKFSLTSAAALFTSLAQCSQIFHFFWPHQTPTSSLEIS